jgi:hypothetical protein
LAYCALRKCCENQIKRAPPVQHRIRVILPYKSNAYHAYHAYRSLITCEAWALYCIAYIDQFSGIVSAMVQHDSLWKWAASQPTQPLQSTKWNAIVPMHIGLRTVLADCPPLPLNSGEEEALPKFKRLRSLLIFY